MRYILAALVMIGLAGAATVLYQRYSKLEVAEAAAPADPASEPNRLRYPADAPQLSSIRTIVVNATTLPLGEPVNARIAYDENRTARISSPIAGRIVSLKGLPGDRVKRGTVLALIDAPELHAASADVEKARSDEGRKRLALERARLLLEGGVLPRKDLELAQSEFEQAESELRRASLRLRNLAPGAVNPLEGYPLRAPLDGVITERQANPAMEVRPDLAGPLYILTDSSRLWVLIDLPERDLAKVRPGKLALVETDAWPNETWDARIERVGEVVDPVTRRIQVRCSIENRGDRLKPEMFARVTLLGDANDQAVRVPNSAIITQGIYTQVFVEVATGVFERRRVSLRLQDRDFAYLGGEVSAGERIVVAGALLLNSELLESR